MPCDQADTITSAEEQRIAWESGICLQEPNWKRTGINGATMKRFYQVWLNAFVKGANQSYNLKIDGNRYEINK